MAVVDWANIYGWFKKLKWKIEPQKLYYFLKGFPEIYDLRFYFGVEKGNRKSEEFQEEIKKNGYNLVSKEVKWVPVSLGVKHFRTKNGKIKSIAEDFVGQFCRRKCDFDVEITKDVLLSLDAFDCLLLFSGDGDYAVLVDELIKRGKQVIVVFAKGCKGKEFGDFKKGLYLCSVMRSKKFLE